jgi:SAM-dependent methyltransferase
MSDLVLTRPRSASARNVRDIADDLGYAGDFLWAFDKYKATIVELARDRDLQRHLEIGGGRDPLFLPDEIESHGFEVTLNDISAHELSLAPDGYRKIVCDITADTAPATLGEGRYDIIYCRMVMEHVPDVAKMWENIYAMLAPGGIVLSFFPTLYAPPFVLNRLMPEKLSRLLLETIFPERRPDGGDPKFPVFYDCCFSDEKKIKPMLERVGFSEITVLPFWGYAYFWKLPGIKQIDAAFTRLARQRNWRAVSSFAYVVAKK